MKALVKVGYGCNENCTFCHTADLRHLDDTAARVEAKIERARELGYTMVVLSGGEPTIRPELLAWARRVASLGMDLGLVTNGLMLSYPEVVRELVDEHRLRYVYMSLHGGEAKVHASVVRAHTFGQAMKAIELLSSGRVPDLTVNCVVTRANLDHLVGVVERLLPFRDLTLKFSMTQPKGAADRLFDVIVPSVSECARKVKEAIEHGLAAQRATGEDPHALRFAHDGIPFCLLAGLERLYDDLKTHRFAAMIEADEDDFVPVDDVAKVHPEPCDGCALRGACPGLYRGYHEVHGHAELRTRRLDPARDTPRGNSYNFVPQLDIARPPGAPCPLRRAGATPYDRARTLFLRLPDRMRLFRTETRELADDQLLFTKEAIGQVYLDVSGKVAPDDFARDLKKLVPTAECTACEARPGCTGAWTVEKGDPFTRDDEPLVRWLGTLEGRILDLGCGEGRYLPALLGAGRRVQYTGVDPDADSLERLRARHGSAAVTFHHGQAEELGGLPGVAASFDHVLFLRSYNHLLDPERALDLAVERLAVGGTLTLVDNVPFGLVRQRAQARRAEGSSFARLEHRRNESSADVARRIEARRRPLRLELRRDVDRTTSDQWLLRYVRTEEPS